MQTLRTLFYLLLDPQSLEPCLVLAGTWRLLWIIMIFVWIWLEKLWLLHDLSRKPATPMLISIQFYKCLLVLCYIPRRLCVGLWLFTPGYTGQILVENGLNSSLPLRFFSKVPGSPIICSGSGPALTTHETHSVLLSISLFSSQLDYSLRRGAAFCPNTGDT